MQVIRNKVIHFYEITAASLQSIIYHFVKPTDTQSFIGNYSIYCHVENPVSRLIV